jgi:ABC-type transporter Mla subunit MlaD
MRQLDLRVVQRGVRRQLEASQELFDTIDSLKVLRDGLPADKQRDIDATIRRLGSVASRIVESAGDVSDDLQRFVAS